uniref:NADH-ubiquinone oxidoreductase chain 5 n=1 Tax=Rhagophthalmus lufengensis TaxID=398797 RepID=A4UAW3_9COLE|nr:NADH dehydrogenase subunit 5 [Rhagophthalmus lufengensis]ABI14546.1 NADH dehydrogenase subunit 5 [Rhagophthalmus lufengensis]
MSICFIYFIFLLFFSMMSFFFSIYFMIIDYMIMLEIEIMSLNSNLIYMSLLFDWMSLLFMSFVLYISSMVIYYSDWYMGDDLNMNRFIILVFMFVLSMIFLIISPNLISILLGWDGLGLVSYCLVIYYQNIKSYNAGMLTALSNRIGDVAILISIAWMMNYGSWNYIYYLDMMKTDFEMEVVCFLVFIAAITKSAQIPFSSWLPAAMAAPTPVSALVHSSTLVTAGVYLLIRFSPCLSKNLMFFLLFLSLMTMFMAGLGANYEYDLKKIIALSTLSQLGMMMSILSLGDYKLSFFHLLVHALFKALLFMCAGIMIHNLNNNQDIRYMGSLIYQMPLTCCFFNMCNFALCGIPFMSGFYSKDLILEVLSMSYLNLFVYFIFYFSIGLTVSYSVRLMYYVFWGVYNFKSFFIFGNDFMLKGMLGLIFFVIFSGSMLMWLMFPTPYFICLSFYMKLMVLMIIFFGIWFGYEFSKFDLKFILMLTDFYYISMFFSSMFNLPFISTFGVNKFPLDYGLFCYKSLDQGWSEYYGSQNIYNSLKSNSMIMQFFSSNMINVYLSLLVILIFFIIFI